MVKTRKYINFDFLPAEIAFGGGGRPEQLDRDVPAEELVSRPEYVGHSAAAMRDSGV